MTFDLQAGEAAKAAGTTLAEDAVRVAAWKAHAIAELEQLAARGTGFTADDLVAVAGLPDVGTNRNNAMGAIFSAAARQGWITKTGDYRKSRRIAAHARVLAVWVGTESQEREGK